MKVLHLSTSDANGGAARGAYWMHKALQQVGVDSCMLVANKGTSDSSVIGSSGITGSEKIWNGVRQSWEYLPLKRYKNKTSALFSPAVYAKKVLKTVADIDPDIINLHWINEGFIKPELFRQFKKPIVWTLRDMWSFTGGCHYTGDCTRYHNQCGQCPVLGSTQDGDLSRQVWQRKHDAWAGLDLTLVAVSRWVADCASQSSLFRSRPIEVITNVVNSQVYRPFDKQSARQILGLPQDKKLLLFGALRATSDKRKGFKYLISALQQLAQDPVWRGQAEVVIFGADKPQQPIDLGFKATYLGRLNDDTTLALAYSSADVTVLPSLQDAFSKMPVESMACGTPVVSFDCTGFKDAISHQIDGYRARCFEPEDLAHGINWVLSDSQRWQSLSKKARQHVEEKFNFEYQANAYLQLYQKVLASQKIAIPDSSLNLSVG